MTDETLVEILRQGLTVYAADRIVDLIAEIEQYKAKNTHLATTIIGEFQRFGTRLDESWVDAAVRILRQLRSEVELLLTELQRERDAHFETASDLATAATERDRLAVLINGSGSAS